MAEGWLGVGERAKKSSAGHFRLKKNKSLYSRNGRSVKVLSHALVVLNLIVDGFVSRNSLGVLWKLWCGGSNRECDSILRVEHNSSMDII